MIKSRAMTKHIETIDNLDNASLITQLRGLGVRHLRAISSVEDVSPADPVTLINSPAQHPEARFREALIPLFRRQPHLADHIPQLVASLEEPAAQVLSHLYTAAVYLQRLWRGVLGLYLGDSPLLPDYFGQSFGLPDPVDYFGEVGLHALATHFREQTGYEWFSAYEAVI